MPVTLPRTMFGSGLRRQSEPMGPFMFTDMILEFVFPLGLLSFLVLCLPVGVLYLWPSVNFAAVPVAVVCLHAPSFLVFYMVAM